MYSLITPAIIRISLADKPVAVTGSGFFDTGANKLVISMEAENQKSKPVPLPATFTQDKLSFDLPTLPPVCWSMQVKAGTAISPALKPEEEILSPATAAPKLTGQL